MSHSSRIHAALAGLLAVGIGMPASGATAHEFKAPEGKEKCYGVTKAGQNECGTSKHACAGMGKVDKDPTDWQIVAKGSCEKIGGKTTPPAAPASPAAPTTKKS